MTVARFLRGRSPVRPNPVMPSNWGWRVWVRGADDVLLPWSPVAEALGSVDDARADLESPAGTFAPLELVRIDHEPPRADRPVEHWAVDPSGQGVRLPGAAAIADRRLGFAAWSPDGHAWLAPFGADWSGAWGGCPRGSWQAALALSAGVDPPVLWREALGIARRSLTLPNAARGWVDFPFRRPDEPPLGIVPAHAAEMLAALARLEARGAGVGAAVTEEAKDWLARDEPQSDPARGVALAIVQLAKATDLLGGPARAAEHPIVSALYWLATAEAWFGGAREAPGEALHRAAGTPTFERAAAAHARALREAVPFAAVLDALLSSRGDWP